MLRVFKILIGMFLSSSLCATTFAGPIGIGEMVVGVSLGPTWVDGTSYQTFNLQPDVVKTYTTNNRNSIFPTAELFVAWQNPLAIQPMGQAVLSQLGISFVAAGNAKLSGNIWEDADPDFNNFNYDYKVRHTHIALKGRLIGNCKRIIEPYISGSIGVGFNRAYNFTITPKISEEVPAPPFQSKTTTSFIYTIGIGVQTSLTNCLQAAIGYEFANWGTIKLGRAQGQTVNQGLSQNHFYAHQIQFSLFYIV